MKLYELMIFESAATLQRPRLHFRDEFAENNSTLCGQPGADGGRYAGAIDGEVLQLWNGRPADPTRDAPSLYFCATCVAKARKEGKT